MGVVADSALRESEARKLPHGAFRAYYRTFFVVLWHENVYRTAGVLWALTAIAVTFGCSRLLGAEGAGLTAMETALASLVLGALWVAWKFVVYAPRYYEEGRQARRDHLNLQARNWTQKLMLDRSADLLRLIEFSSENSTEAWVIHHNARRIAEQAVAHLTQGSDEVTLHPRAAEEILAAIGPDVPPTPKAAVAEAEGLRRVIEDQLRASRFLSATP
jgi:hypothetical protein